MSIANDNQKMVCKFSPKEPTTYARGGGSNETSHGSEVQYDTDDELNKYIHRSNSCSVWFAIPGTKPDLKNCQQCPKTAHIWLL